MEDEKVPVCEETFDWIRKVTTEFYELVYKDPWFSKIFSKVEQKIITSQQIDFMIQKFGGPKRFCGRSPKDAHPHVWVDQNIWDYREKLLLKACYKVGAPKNIIDKLIKIDEAFKEGIINHGGPEECHGRYKTEEIIYHPMPSHSKKAS